MTFRKKLKELFEKHYDTQGLFPWDDKDDALLDAIISELSKRLPKGTTMWHSLGGDNYACTYHRKAIREVKKALGGDVSRYNYWVLYGAES